MKKKIKASTRGLTFTLTEDDIKIGAKYRYIIDKNNNEILIIPDECGNMTVSKKRTGTKVKPLFDIRSKEVKKLVSAADYLEVSIRNEQIVVTVYKKTSFTLIKGGKCTIQEVLGTKAGQIILPYAKVSGDDGYQYTIYDWISSITEITENVSYEETLSISKDLKTAYDTVSFFSGAGLFDKAFLDTGKFRFVYANDFCKDVVETYEQNIGHHMHCKDIREVKGHEIPFANVFLASPCCQAFSNANRTNMHSAESEEKRLLVEEVVRLVTECEVKPDVIVVENVPQMVTKEKGIYISKLLDGLPDYEADVKIVTDCKLGGFTERQRCIVILSKIGKIQLPDLDIIPKRTVRDALSKVDASWYNFEDYSKAKGETLRKMQCVPPGGNWRNIPAEVFKYGPHTHSDVMRRLAWDEVAPTITNVRKVNMMPPEGNRCLSVAEAAALMGLSKDFKFFGKLSAMQQMVANGVTQAIGKLVANTVANALDSFHSSEFA